MDGDGLDGLRVVVTREADPSARFADHLRAHDAQPIICPAIEIRFRNPPGFDEALRHLDRFDWIVFTSANAVRAVTGRCRELSIDPVGALMSTRIAAIGQATAAGLHEIGLQAELRPDEQTGGALAAAMTERDIEGRLILFPASRIARPDLPNALRIAGAGVVQFGVYDTFAPIDLPDDCQVALQRGAVDVLTFFSPSAVRHFIDMAGKRFVDDFPAICIGETTADALRECAAREPIVAGEASADGMIAALLEFKQRM